MTINDGSRFCRICGYDPGEAPWEGGKHPTFFYCDCCGVEYGVADSTVSGADDFRGRWLDEGAPWRYPRVPHDSLTTRERLSRIGVMIDED